MRLESVYPCNFGVSHHCYGVDENPLEYLGLKKLSGSLKHIIQYIFRQPINRIK